MNPAALGFSLFLVMSTLAVMVGVIFINGLNPKIKIIL